ncbi:hypothetical protein QJS10_CPA08g00936 [Acorus calamus]|uniref:DUF4283 domain-containing protein n=1 Tax=Acorus calamus TaxID=4465 RepID=A0AAV9EBP3_ACOCL|nr:hypothetical protein QJS10_CPA08g00936 [Acorus calamus]
MGASLTPKAWSELFVSPPDSSTHCSLDFTEPQTEDGIPKIWLDEEDYERALNKWGKAVVGYVIGKIPVYTPFLAFIKKLWKIKGDIQLSLQGNGFFIVQFDLQEDMQRVLEGGPWTMDNRPFVLQKWSPSVRMEQERLTSIPIWMATRITFARVCVEVEAGKALPDSVVIESKADGREIFPIIYDWKPQACSHCQTFGHDDALCCKRSRLLPQAPKGPPMVAPPSERKAVHFKSSKNAWRVRRQSLLLFTKRYLRTQWPLQFCTQELVTNLVDSTMALPPVQMQVSAVDDSLPKNGVLEVEDNAAAQQSAQQEQSITSPRAFPQTVSSESLCNSLDDGLKASDKIKSAMLRNVKDQVRMQTLPHGALAPVETASAADLLAYMEEQRTTQNVGSSSRMQSPHPSNGQQKRPTRSKAAKSGAKSGLAL